MKESLKGLVHTHIPKCGGNSIVAACRHLADLNNLNLLSFSGASSVNSNILFINELTQNMSFELDEVDLVVGHLPYATASKVFSNKHFTVSLRDPIYRYISNYCSQPFNKVKEDFGMSSFCDAVELEENQEWAIDNIQTRMLSDDPKFGYPIDDMMLSEAMKNLDSRYHLVGFVDELNSFIVDLMNLDGNLDAKAPSIKLNQTGDYSRFFNQEHLNLAKKVNYYDCSLYWWAKTKLEDKGKIWRKRTAFQARQKRFETIFTEHYLVNY